MVDSTTIVGTSAISSEGPDAAAALRAAGVEAIDAFASVSRVRRGVPKRSATSSSSSADADADASGVAEQRLELGDLGLQLVALVLELDAAELGEASQLQFEDVVGLQRAEVEHLDQPGARLRRHRRWPG